MVNDGVTRISEREVEYKAGKIISRCISIISVSSINMQQK